MRGTYNHFTSIMPSASVLPAVSRGDWGKTEIPCLPSRQTRKDCSSPNTGLPAPVTSFLPPNPCAVMPFAKKKGRKRPALTAGSAARERYMTWQESSGAKGRRSKALDPPGEEVERMPIPIPPPRSFAQPCGAPPLISPLAGVPPAPFLVSCLDRGGRTWTVVLVKCHVT